MEVEYLDVLHLHCMLSANKQFVISLLQPPGCCDPIYPASLYLATLHWYIICDVILYIFIHSVHVY